PCFEFEFRTESASGALSHSFTCHAMRCILTPLIRWPNSLCHYIPYYVNGKNIQDTESELDAVLQKLDCSFYVSFKTTIEDIVDRNGGVYNTVILVGIFA
ncbi:hypothetical protein, partial [Vibrio parahaemolyticus]